MRFTRAYVSELEDTINRKDAELALMKVERDRFHALYNSACVVITDHTKSLQVWRESLNVGGTRDEGGINLTHKEDI